MRYLLSLFILVWSASFSVHAAIEYTPEEALFITTQQNSTIPIYIPYSSVKDQDVQFLFALISQLNQHSGLKFTLVNEGFGVSFGKVAQGEMAVLSDVTPLIEREDVLFFTPVYYKRPTYVLSRSSLEDCCSSGQAFAGRSVAAVAGSYYETSLKALGAEVIPFTTYHDLMQAFNQGRFQMAVLDWPDADDLIRETKRVSNGHDQTHIFVKELQAGLMPVNEVALAVNKKYPALFSILQKHFDVVEQTVNLEVNTGFLPSYTSEELAYLTENATPRLCIPDVGAPYNSPDETGKRQGLVIDKLAVIAEKIGLVFETMTLPITTYGTREVDALCDVFFNSTRAQLPESFYTGNQSFYLGNAVTIAMSDNPEFFTYERLPDYNVGLPLPRLLGNSLAAQNTYADDFDKLLKALEAGRIDVILTTVEQAMYYRLANPQLNLSIGALDTSPLDIRFAAKQQHKLLVDILDRGLSLVTPAEQEYLKHKNILSHPNASNNSLLLYILMTLLSVVSISLIMALKQYRKNKAQRHLVNKQYAFLNELAHELRTPLNGVYGILQILKSHDRLPEELAPILDLGLVSAENIISMVSDLLEVERLRLGQLNLDLNECDPSKIIKELVQSQRDAFGNKNIELEYCVDSGVPRVMTTDIARLTWVMTRLLGNAVAVTECGVISVRLMAVNKKLLIKIRDAGPGIEHNKIASILSEKALSSISPSLSHEQLSLAVTKAMIELLGGEIEVVYHPGMGTEYSVLLPMHLGDIAIEHQGDKTTFWHEKRALIAEISKEGELQLSEYCRALGMVIDKASNEADFILHITANLYDVIMLDVDLLALNSKKLIVKFDTLLKHTPIVALVENVTEYEVTQLLLSGFSDVIVKPIRPEQVASLLQRLGIGAN